LSRTVLSATNQGICGGCGCDKDTSGELIDVEDQPVRPCSEGIQEVPLGVSSVMQPSSTVHSLATWLLGYLRYTCGVLGYLAACLLPLHVNQHEEANEASHALNQERGVLTVDRSNIADRWVLVICYSKDMNCRKCLVR
jgi:hypothetical protein